MKFFRGICIAFFAVLCTVCLYVAGVALPRSAAAEEEPLAPVSMEMLWNQDGGANHHLLIKFNKTVSARDGYNQVDDALVRNKILINGRSIYEYQLFDSIVTQCYYNTNGADTIRINIPVSKWNVVFRSDEATGGILDTQIVLQSGLTFETGDVLSRDYTFTYFALGEIFLGEGENLADYTINVYAVHYYAAKKHLRIYFDAPVGTYGGGLNEPISSPAAEKILINGRSVKDRNLELYMDPASIIGPSSVEGNWYEYDENGEKIEGGMYGYINCRYMIRISLSSSSGIYNLNLDGTDVVEILPGLVTATGKIVTNTSVWKLNVEDIGKPDEEVDFFEKAKNIVEAQVKLSEGTDGRAELLVYSSGSNYPASEAKVFSSVEIGAYFSRLSMNGVSLSEITGLKAESVAQEGGFALKFTFPEGFIAFDGTDVFRILNGYVYPNGNDSRSFEKAFVNDPLSVEIVRTGGISLQVKFGQNIANGIADVGKISFKGQALTAEYCSVEKNVLTVVLNDELSDGDTLVFESGCMDGDGNAVSGEIVFVYQSEIRLMTALNAAFECTIDAVNILKNQDNGINSWVEILFKSAAADYSSYPYQVTGDAVNMYSYITINGTPVTEAGEGNFEVYWLSDRSLRINVRSECTLIDFEGGLTFKIDGKFRTNLNGGLSEDFVRQFEAYSERDGIWVERFGEDGKLASTNYELEVTGIGAFNDEGENMSVAITFNQDVAYGYYPHANATANFMSALLSQYYSENEIKYFVYNGLGDSIRDNILLDGKSIWERMQEEGAAVMNSLIMVHYGTVGTATLQIFISKNCLSADFVDPSAEHTITIKAGFQVPNGGVLAETVTYKYNPVTMSWAPEGDGTDVSEIPTDEGLASYPCEDDADDSGAETSGCKSVAAGAPILVLSAYLCGFTALKKRKEKEGGNER